MTNGAPSPLAHLSPQPPTTFSPECSIYQLPPALGAHYDQAPTPTQSTEHEPTAAFSRQTPATHPVTESVTGSVTSSITRSGTHLLSSKNKTGKSSVLVHLEPKEYERLKAAATRLGLSSRAYARQALPFNGSIKILRHNHKLDFRTLLVSYGSVTFPV